MDQSGDFTTSFTVDQPPEAVFAAINDVRAWWSGEVKGNTDALGATFTYRYQDLHYSVQTVAEFIPARRVVWHIADARLSFTANPDEWVGTDIAFEIAPRNGGTEVRFTHRGLTPKLECYEDCSGAWTFYISESLRHLITTGVGQPNPVA